ncbi:MAG: TVP38/TMEM64 family protein [Candidatus Aenigmarchaeota archaeon]|nr:TVP38/TMEM64 family protein [Candidatus Aenigmarchaeota archaeon]
MLVEVISYIIAVSLATIIPPFTVIPLELVAPARYGLIPAFIYTVIGNIIGALVAFMLARKYGWKLLEKLFKEKDLKKAREIAKCYGFWRITWLRFIFASFFDVLSYACGLTEISIEKYLLSTIISNIPIMIIVLGFGNRINLNFAFIVWFSVGILVVSVAIVIKKLRERNEEIS